jgi:hypothetical protein
VSRFPLPKGIQKTKGIQTAKGGLPDTHRLEGGLPDTHRLARGILIATNHSERGCLEPSSLGAWVSGTVFPRSVGVRNRLLGCLEPSSREAWVSGTVFLGVWNRLLEAWVSGTVFLTDVFVVRGTPAPTRLIHRGSLSFAI